MVLADSLSKMVITKIELILSLISQNVLIASLRKNVGVKHRI